MTQFRGSPSRKNLAINVITLRAQQGLSQTALAQSAGVGRPTVSRIERAALEDVSLKTIERLAEALGASVPELLSPVERSIPNEKELQRRSEASDEFVDADVFFDALDEATSVSPARYSRAGRRPSVVR